MSVLPSESLSPHGPDSGPSLSQEAGFRGRGMQEDADRRSVEIATFCL